MRALQENEFPVPRAVECNRHAVLMSMVQAYPLTQVGELADPIDGFRQVVGMLTRLAEHGLIHCDLNEFNLLVDDEGHMTMIDFPQMVSVSHPNAKMYFERDAECLRIYFARKFGLDEEDGLQLIPRFEDVALGKDGQLDSALQASGFSKEDDAALQRALEATQGEVDEEEGEEEDEEEEEMDESAEDDAQGTHERVRSASAATARRSKGAQRKAEQDAAMAGVEGVDNDEESEEGSDEEEDESGSDGDQNGQRPPGKEKAQGKGRGRGKPKAEWSNELVHQRILQQRKRQQARMASARKANRNKLIGKEKGKANDGW